MTTLTVPRLTDDPEFRKAKQQREKLQREAEKIKEELGNLGEDAPHLRDKRRELGERYKAAQADLQTLGNVLQAEKRRAGASAAAKLVASPGYRGLVLDALVSWAGAIGPWLDLAATVTEARSSGVEVQPLPPVLAVEIEQVVAWTKAAIARGTVGPNELPEALQALVKGR